MYMPSNGQDSINFLEVKQMLNYIYGISLSETELAEQEEAYAEYSKAVDAYFNTISVSKLDRVYDDSLKMLESLEKEIELAETAVDTTQREITFMHSIRSLSMTPLQSFDFAVDMKTLRRTLREGILMLEIFDRLRDLVNARLYEFMKKDFSKMIADAGRLEGLI